MVGFPFMVVRCQFSLSHKNVELAPDFYRPVGHHDGPLPATSCQALIRPRQRFQSQIKPPAATQTPTTSADEGSGTDDNTLIVPIVEPPAGA